MKKFMYLGAAALAGLFATSCAGDEPVAGTTDGMTTFTVQMPEDLTRAFADGTSATKLCVAIYESGKQEAPRFSNFGSDANLNGMDIKPGATRNWTVSVPLVKGKAYDIVCWAQSYANTDKTVYEYNETARTITVNYQNMANYDEARDAFFGSVTYTSGSNADNTIKLYRPFAQINVLTSDYQAYKYGNGTANADPDPNTFGISVTGLSNTLNIFSGAIESTLAEGTAIPTGLAAVKDGDTKGTGDDAVTYNYLAMAYVLAGTDATHGKSLGTTVNVTLNTNDKEGFANYPNVPVRPNYRTNIYGQLLTNSEIFNVEILPGFAGDDINYFVPVTSEADFNAAIAAGKCPVLQQDITVTTITPTGGNASVDLNNHTLSVSQSTGINGNVSIKNGTLAVDMERRAAEGKSGRVSLLTLMKNGNLNLENVKVNDTKNVYTAVLMTPDASWASTNGSVMIDGCNFTTATMAVSTNAGDATQLKGLAANLPYTITINNSTLNAHTGVLLNVPANLVMNKCNVTGDYQGVIVRGGTATITDCDITTTCNEPAYEFDDYNWASGNGVPIAAMTVGNDGTYDFAINVTTTGCTFNVLKGALTQIWLDKSGNTRINIPCVFAKKGTAKDVNVNLNGSKYNNAIGGQDVYNEDATVK